MNRASSIDQLSWISPLIRSLYREGVRHAILSPGSRSTPLVFSISMHPGLKKYVVLDERSAGFRALGIGKATGIPALLVCTSGTAVANYFPAVVEAKESGTPLIILSADRPPRLRGSGSSQTIDQIKLFGDQAVWFHETGEPVDKEGDLSRFSLLGRQAVTEAIRRGGAVQINIPFSKPLEPTRQTIKLEREMYPVQEPSLRVAPSEEIATELRWPADSMTLHPSVREVINRSRRPLILSGPQLPAHTPAGLMRQLCDITRAPVLCEAGSMAPRGPNHLPWPALFGERRKIDEEPDLILRFGDYPYSPQITRLLERPDGPEIIEFTTREEWQDPYGKTLHRVPLHSDRLNPDGLDSKPETWLNNAMNWATEAAGKRDALLESEERLTDGHVIHHFTRQLSDDWEVMLSNSLIVRDYSFFGALPGYPGPAHVNRGAAGIDGILSTASGIQTGSGRPTLVFIGDLAMLHDSNALLSLRTLTGPLIIIVINNGGGSIFRMLPVHSFREVFTSYFETPQEADIRLLAHAHGLKSSLINDRKGLEKVSLEKLRETAEAALMTDAKGNPRKADMESLKSPGRAHGGAPALLLECRTDPEASHSLRNALKELS
ncbi:MAG: 2-succinyl-5-enolpyruvyl-6-hydroxy-3-cyclohexene-1-carboxylic-acid synthase [Balneolaceae bacterium]